jgi:hypothetical protein
VGTPHFPKFVGIQLSYLIIPIVIMTRQTTLGVSYTVAFTKIKMNYLCFIWKVPFGYNEMLKHSVYPELLLLVAYSKNAIVELQIVGCLLCQKYIQNINNVYYAYIKIQNYPKFKTYILTIKTLVKEKLKICEQRNISFAI